MALPLIASAAAPIVGNLLGGLFGSGDAERARQELEGGFQKALAVVGDPELAKQLVLQEYRSAGKLTPELEQALGLGDSSVAGIQEDPSGRKAQLRALQAMQQVGSSGFTPDMIADVNRARMERERDAQAKLAQIQQEAQMRGQAGGGASIAASLLAAQQGANRAATEGQEMAGLASRNALQALGSAGTLGGNLRGTDFDIANTKARARDAFKQFDVQNMQNVGMRNVNAKNDANLFNLRTNQGILDANVRQSNQAAADAMNRRVGQAKELGSLYRQQGEGMNKQYGAQAAATQDMWSKIGTGAGQMASLLGNNRPKAPTLSQDGAPKNYDSLSLEEKLKYDGKMLG
jgi:hypothetical protein